VGLFAVASFAVWMGEGYIWTAFCADSCGPAYEAPLSYAIVAFSAGILIALAGLQLLMGASRWIALLAPALACFIAGWGWIDYRLSTPLAVAGPYASPSWIQPAGPVALLCIGLVIAS
jgi:hypothetical protein